MWVCLQMLVPKLSRLYIPMFPIQLAINIEMSIRVGQAHWDRTLGFFKKGHRASAVSHVRPTQITYMNYPYGCVSKMGTPQNRFLW